MYTVAHNDKRKLRTQASKEKNLRGEDLLKEKTLGRRRLHIIKTALLQGKEETIDHFVLGEAVTTSLREKKISRKKNNGERVLSNDI